MSEQMAATEERLGLERVLLAALIDEYGEDAEMWTEMGSLRRVAQAVRDYDPTPDRTREQTEGGAE